MIRSVRACSSKAPIGGWLRVALAAGLTLFVLAGEPASARAADSPAEPAPGNSPSAPAPDDRPAPLKPLDALGQPDGFAQEPDWRQPSVDDVRRQVMAWLDQAQPDASARSAAESLWPAGQDKLAGEALLVRVAATFALVDPRAKQLVELCRRDRSAPAPPDFAWLADEATPAFERANLRLLYGRWLSHERMSDEALAQLSSLAPADVVDPAGLLFYQGVACHRLLKMDEAVAALTRLLERPDDAPRRHASLARLMLADLKGLEEDSLDHIDRRMQDIERRLDLGRAGPKTRDVEDGVIRSLDKLIEEMEKQQQAAAAAAAAAGRGGIRSTAPAQDSLPLGGKGAGQVDKKPIGAGSGWGDLPPKQRQEALQQIGKDYPAHYRDLIEQYFRKLASEDETPQR